MRRALIVLIPFALLAAPPAGGYAAGIDGPGSYYMLRSFDTGQPFTEEQEQACLDYFGTVRNATAVDLNAGAFAFTGDPETGRVIDQKASYLGPGFGCLAPAASPDLLEFYVGAIPPLFGLAKATGFCPSSVAPTQPGVLLLACQLRVAPEPSSGALGGLMTSSTVVNPRNVVPGAPTGSVWTVYNVPERGNDFPPPIGGQPPAGTPEPSKTLDFYVFRTFGDTTASASPNCPSSPLAPVVGARSSALYATAPDLVDGKVPQGLGPQRGALAVCFTSDGQSDRSAVARLSIVRGGRMVHLSAEGSCRDFSTPAGAALRQQACNLRISPTSEQLLGGIRGGLITSNGLVRAGAPLQVANSHIWTLALFVDPT